MSISAFPAFARAPIDDPGDIAAIEATITALCGVVVARGGFVALAGAEMLALAPLQRARLLTPMYDEGEVIFGWRDGVGGAVWNVVLERMAGADGAGFVAEVFVERADGHHSVGAVAAAAPAALQGPLCAVAAGGAGPLPTRGAALAALARTDRRTD